MYIEGVGSKIETKTDAYKIKLCLGKAKQIAQLIIGEGGKTGFHTAHQYDELFILKHSTLYIGWILHRSPPKTL